MNPDLTAQIKDRLSHIHDENTRVTAPGTLIAQSPTAPATKDGVSVTVDGLPADVPVGGLVRGDAVVYTARGAAKTLFELQVDDALVSMPAEVTVMSSPSFGPVQHNVLGGEGHVTFSQVAEEAKVGTEEAVEEGLNPDEIDTEFWKSFGMNGPEDMTPDKLGEITKKLRDFQRSLKHVQKHHPVTMGMMVPIRKRTPKHRKRKK